MFDQIREILDADQITSVTMLPNGTGIRNGKPAESREIPFCARTVDQRWPDNHRFHSHDLEQTSLSFEFGPRVCVAWLRLVIRAKRTSMVASPFTFIELTKTNRLAPATAAARAKRNVPSVLMRRTRPRCRPDRA